MSNKKDPSSTTFYLAFKKIKCQNWKNILSTPVKAYECGVFYSIKITNDALCCPNRKLTTSSNGQFIRKSDKKQTFLCRVVLKDMRFPNTPWAAEFSKQRSRCQLQCQLIVPEDISRNFPRHDCLLGTIERMGEEQWVCFADTSIGYFPKWPRLSTHLFLIDEKGYTRNKWKKRKKCGPCCHF